MSDLGPSRRARGTAGRWRVPQLDVGDPPDERVVAREALVRVQHDVPAVSVERRQVVALDDNVAREEPDLPGIDGHVVCTAGMRWGAPMA